MKLELNIQVNASLQSNINKVSDFICRSDSSSLGGYYTILLCYFFLVGPVELVSVWICSGKPHFGQI